MFSCYELSRVLILITTYVFSAKGLPYAKDETFAGIKLYNSLEKSLLSKYEIKPDYILANTNPVAPRLEEPGGVKIFGEKYGQDISANKLHSFAIGNHGDESILDENYLKDTSANNFYNLGPGNNGGESILDEMYPKDTSANKLYTQADHDAFIKITNALYKRPVSAKYGEGVHDEHSKKVLNGVLVAQLQSLLDSVKFLAANDEEVVNGASSLPTTANPSAAAIEEKTTFVKNPYANQKEHLFLVLNDEMKSTTNDELIYVDPNSLGADSTVFMLGTLNELFSNEELNKLMKKVQAELLKPKYLRLLFTLSSGSKVQELNAELGPNIFTGANARRYVKAHRCNYQSPMAKIKNGGPMWVICSGYLNINTPSLYDK